MRSRPPRRPPYFFIIPPAAADKRCLAMARDVRDGRVGETSWRRWCGGGLPNRWLRVATTPIVATSEYRELVLSIFFKNILKPKRREHDP